MEKQTIELLNGFGNAAAAGDGNAVLYLVQLTILFIVAASAAYFGSYLRRKGEHDAIMADLTGLKVKIEATTSAAEGVKWQLGKLSEFNTLRVSKLEETMTQVWTITDVFRKEFLSATINLTSPVVDPTIVLRSRTLVRFYFPDEFEHLHRFLCKWEECLIQVHNDLRAFAEFPEKDNDRNILPFLICYPQPLKQEAETLGLVLERALVDRMHSLLGQLPPNRSVPAPA